MVPLCHDLADRRRLHSGRPREVNRCLGPPGAGKHAFKRRCNASSRSPVIAMQPASVPGHEIDILRCDELGADCGITPFSRSPSSTMMMDLPTLAGCTVDRELGNESPHPAPKACFTLGGYYRTAWQIGNAVFIPTATLDMIAACLLNLRRAVVVAVNKPDAQSIAWPVIHSMLP
jgi:hypothetical protein